MSLTIEQIQRIHDALENQNKGLQQINDFGISRKTTTTKIIRIIAAILVILLVFNLFIMFQLNTHLMNIVKQIDTMKHSFNQVSEDMKGINNDVDEISQTMILMPIISSSMQSIDKDMPIISKSMYQITNNMGLVETKLLNINAKVYTVSHKMGLINLSTQHIQSNMREIAQPTQFFNWMLPN